MKQRLFTLVSMFILMLMCSVTVRATDSIDGTEIPEVYEASTSFCLSTDENGFFSKNNSTPFNCIGSVKSSRGTSSGFMISSQYMLTAAHAVYNDLNKVVKVTFPMTGKTLDGTVVYICPEYSNEFRSPGSDYAVIRIEKAPEHSLGWFGLHTNSYKNQVIEAAGIVNTKLTRYVGRIFDTNPSNVLTYNIQTVNGMSGGPIHSNGVYAYGLVSGTGTNSSGTSSKVGFRVTYKFIESLVAKGFVTWEKN